jgi:tetratricopeptide (TPR) repeat protein
MKTFLFFILLFSVTASYGQSQPDTKRIKQAVSAIEKGECILIFYEERFASDFEKKQIKEFEVISQLDFGTLDSLFTKNTDSQVRLTLFYVLCKKYRSQITEKHLKAFETNQEVTMCSGRNTQKGPLNQIATYLYKNSVERKEKITNPEVLALLKEAQELEFKGPVDFELMIEKLNKANQLEPNNPIILDALAHAKFDSKIDPEGALNDFQQAITYSLDQSSLEIRYLNRGLSFMDMGNIEAACEDWKKAGDHGLSYLEQHCSQPYDRTIHNNPDSDLTLKLSLARDTAFIVSSHNSPAMSDCFAKLLIENNNLPKITVKESNLNFCLEDTDSELYLEAISEDGTKFHFFTETEISFSGNGKDLVIDPKGAYTKNLNVTGFHQFPIAGTYKIRIAIRPTRNILGLTKTYYSNWVNLVIGKNYQKDY